MLEEYSNIFLDLDRHLLHLERMLNYLDKEFSILPCNVKMEYLTTQNPNNGSLKGGC